MTPELFWLTATAFATLLMVFPYVLNRIAVRGLMGALANPSSEDRPHSPWAERAKAAHGNAVENLVIFAPLVLAAVAAEATNSATAMAAMIYLFARVAHYAVYTAGVPGLRTLTYGIGAACQVAIAIALFQVA